MDKAITALQEWLQTYLKNKDAFLRKIKNMEVKGEDIIISYADYQRRVIIQPTLQESIVYQKKEEHLLVVTLNNQTNLDFLIKQWKRLAEMPNLSMYFANPLSTMDKVWIIFPHTHNKVCDQASLKTGLTAMAELVEYISEESFKERSD